ncbi:protein translocase subunit SecDF [Chungangia koreensis]|uniref:Multifunctional fusion protein n=1 Tax=Chungangia koreensis TaxID=752657 RepID=A0ABV8X1W5_9LACT
MKTRGRIVAFLLVVLVLAASMSTTAKGILHDIKLGLDLQGGFEVLYEVQPLKEDGNQKITEEVVADTASALINRVDVLGVNEPVIQVEGKDRIRVQLAGVEDQESARELLSTQANLTFRDSDDNLMLGGDDLKEGGANATFDEQGRPIVTLQLKDANKFAEVTKEISAKPYPDNVMVIWLDYQEGMSFREELTKEDPAFVSAPSVKQVISSTEVQISGSFTPEETKNLAGILNAGSLPVHLEEIYSTSVGAQFGDDALSSTVLASIIGVALIFIFMLFYYRIPGLVAIITLSVFVYLNLLIFDWINGTLTLPGIAALVLGVGMAVDANILTAERIKEELRIGKTVKQAYHEGSKNSFSAILDANVTTFLAAVVLFFFGTSSIKGFATLLMISIVVTFFTAVWGSRLLMGLIVHSGVTDGKPFLYGIRKSAVHPADEHLDTLDLSTKFDRIDFVHNRKKFFTLSIVLLVAGAIILGVFRLNLGIDFSSGTRMEIVSDNQLTQQEITDYVEEIGYPSEDVVISGDLNNIGVVRYKEEFSQQNINELKTTIQKDYGHDPNISTVSPTVGKELVQNAIYALSIAAIGIIIYVAFRFEWRMGLASIAALLHDAFFMIAIFSILRLEVDITFVAAVLTIIGYSINDTIVTFDRIRENLHKVKKIENADELANIVNKSLRQTLGRSVNTVLTVILVVVALLIFGAPSITNFSIALLIGLIAGTYSSIFISAQLWYVMKAKEIKNKGSLDTEEKKKTWGSDEPVV